MRKKKRVNKMGLFCLSAILLLLLFTAFLSVQVYKLKKSQDMISKNVEEQRKQIEKLLSEIQQKDSSPEENLEKSETAETSEEICEYVPGKLVDAESVRKNIDEFFIARPILKGDAVYQRICNKSFPEDATEISLEELRYLMVVHYNFYHQPQIGELIVNADLSDEMLQIFKELYEKEYEIESMYLIDNYWVDHDAEASDTNSIEHNNTSAFNYRLATGSSKMSKHAYGYAIDINPQQNPYVTVNSEQVQNCYHENAVEYMDRTGTDPHMIKVGDACWTIFQEHGFTWGGSWNNPIDYQHFEKKL